MNELSCRICGQPSLEICCSSECMEQDEMNKLQEKFKIFSDDNLAALKRDIERQQAKLEEEWIVVTQEVARRHGEKVVSELQTNLMNLLK